jgi:hypothetical protein
MISGQTLRVCPEGKPVSTFLDHAPKLDASGAGLPRITVTETVKPLTIKLQGG